MLANSKTLLMPANPVQDGRRVVPGLQLPAASRPFGPNTLQFFEEGERHENTGWQDSELPADEDTDTYVRGGSFDKIPRQKSALLILALLGAGLVTGAALGVRALARTGWKVEASAAAFSRNPAPATPAPTAALVPTATALPPAPPSRPQLTAMPIAKPNAGEAPAGGTVESPGDGDATRATGDKVTSYAIKHVKKLAQASRKYHWVPGKSEPRTDIAVQDEFDQEANPATNGEVVEPPPLRNPSPIEPPQQLAPPPEHPASTVSGEADPFEP